MLIRTSNGDDAALEVLFPEGEERGGDPPLDLMSAHALEEHALFREWDAQRLEQTQRHLGLVRTTVDHHVQRGRTCGGHAG